MISKWIKNRIMARKIKEEANQTKEKILMAALDLFYQKGYGKTSLNDISNSLKMTKGAIYWHFKNKEDLFYSLIEWIWQEVERSMYLKFENVETTDDLKELMIDYVKIVLSNENLRKGYCIFLSRSEWMNELKGISSYIIKKFEEYINFMVKALKKLQDKGEINHDINVFLTAKGILSSIDGIIISSLFLDNFTDTQDQVENLLNIFLKGLNAK